MTDFNMPPPGAGFDARAAWLLPRLMRDLALPLVIHPAAIIGNLGGESGLLAIQEKHPLAGRGGFGWEQATADRRRNFEAFCAAHGWATTNDEANYRFLLNELQTTERHALDQLVKTTELRAATYTFCVYFERPADPDGTLPSRLKWAGIALAAYHAAAPAAVSPAVSPAPARGFFAAVDGIIADIREKL